MTGDGLYLAVVTELLRVFFSPIGPALVLLMGAALQLIVGRWLRRAVLVRGLALLHTKTWFELAPKAANIIVKDEKMGPEPIIKGLWAVTVVATVVILFVALFW